MKNEQLFLGGTPVVGFGIANPASENCVAKGGTFRIVETPAGQSGICVFPDGSECEEWKLYHGECAPGSLKPFVDRGAVFLISGAAVLVVGTTWYLLTRKR